MLLVDPCVRAWALPVTRWGPEASAADPAVLMMALEGRNAMTVRLYLLHLNPEALVILAARP